MSHFRYVGIPAALAAQARQTLASPQYGHPAHREVAHGTGPCRLCLRTFTVGAEDRLLFTYQPFLEIGALPAPGPIFVHAEGCTRYDALELPPDFPIAADRGRGFSSGRDSGRANASGRGVSPNRWSSVHSSSRRSRMSTSGTAKPGASWHEWSAHDVARPRTPITGPERWTRPPPPQAVPELEVDPARHAGHLSGRTVRLDEPRVDSLDDPGLGVSHDGAAGPAHRRRNLSSSRSASARASNSRSIMTKFGSGTERWTWYRRTPDPFRSIGSPSNARFQPSKSGTAC